MNYGKLTAGTTKTAIDTAKPSEKGEIITYLSRMGDVLHEIPEGCEVVGGLVQTVHAIVDGDEAHTVAGEDEFGVLSHLKVLAAQPGHVLHDKGFHLTVFHQLHDLLPTGAVEVGPGVAIVIQE